MPFRTQKVRRGPLWAGRRDRRGAGGGKESGPGYLGGLGAPGKGRLRRGQGRRRRHFGQFCETRVERLVETRPGTPHREIGLSGERLHGGGEFVDGRLVDEIGRASCRERG